MRRGGFLLEPTVAYETWGELNSNGDNGVLIFTGLSPSAHASASPADPAPGWWEEIVGPSRPIDTRKYFVICVNSLGSCFGSTGPASANPLTGENYRLNFPVLTLDDAAVAGKGGSGPPRHRFAFCRSRSVDGRHDRIVIRSAISRDQSWPGPDFNSCAVVALCDCPAILAKGDDSERSGMEKGAV